MASAFSAETRQAVLGTLGGDELDVLVIGGGITGAGVARDAALRGLRVALVEREDWAAGTSSRSSKLIHGGVRYLEQGEIALVRESALERAVLRRIAPHLAQPVRMLMPTRGRAGHAKLGIGLWTFDRLAGVAPDERHRLVGREEALALEPRLAGERIHGAALFTEYLTDDARLVLATVRGAHAAGALCANHAEVTALARGEATIRDTLGSGERTVRARAIVNAAGPWVDAVRTLAGPPGGPQLRLTKGVHLVVPHVRLPLRHIVVMAARDKRGVFAVPHGGCTYLGTTDTDHGPPVLHPEVGGDDADYLLEAANRTFAGPPLGRADVVAAWAGLRPLLHQEGKPPSELSRRDEIMVGPAGLITVAGGKLTTHRRMAERVLDLVGRALDRDLGPSRTDTVPLPGGDTTPAGVDELARMLRTRLPTLPPGAAERLVTHHGTGVRDLVARIDGDADLGTMLPGAAGVLRAEVAHALDEEMALTLEDVLDRRLRLLFFDAHQGLDAVDAAATMAAERLGWDAARTRAETTGYRELAAALRRFP